MLRHVYGLAGGVTLAALGLIVCLGCQPAGRYPPRGTRSEAAAVPQPIVPPQPPKQETPPPPVKFTDPSLVWQEADPTVLETPVPIVYVTELQPEWNRLKGFWTEVEEVKPGMTPNQAAALFAASPVNLAPLAAQVHRTVKIKVPRGLDSPLAYTPASNPPTAGKWQLGNELFFDKALFLKPETAESKLSCATCHDPAKRFGSDQVPRGGLGALAVPRLVNVGYHKYYFWDGRAESLEDAIARSIDTDRAPATGEAPQPHRWSGAVQRLRDDPYYADRFRKVFGMPPTQDAIAKALATYLRTVLSGDSLQDRAERAARQAGRKVVAVPEAGDYENALDDATLKRLKVDEGAKKADVARQLHAGARLFHGKANCVRCHDGAFYTDNGFHNLGVGDSSQPMMTGTERGRFATLAPGLKDRRMIGAYRTPSLRSLPLKGPFFHDGLRLAREDGIDGLFDVVAFHLKGGASNPYLDPELTPVKLDEVSEVRPLVLFLQALDGAALPDEVTREARPELLPLPKK